MKSLRNIFLFLVLAGVSFGQFTTIPAGSGGGSGVALSDDPTWTGNHLFAPSSAQTTEVPYAPGAYNIDTNVTFRPTPVSPTGRFYANASILDLSTADLDDTEHIGYFSYLKMGAVGQTNSYMTAYDFLVEVPAAGGTPLYTYGLRGNINNFLADNTLHSTNFVGSLVSGGDKKVGAGLYIGGTGAGSELLEGIHINTVWEQYGIHIQQAATPGSDYAGLYLDATPALFTGMTATGTPPANKLYVYAKTGAPEQLCTKDEDGTETCLGNAGTATNRQTSLVRFISFDAIGNGYADKLSNFATNDLSLAFAAAFADAGTIQIPMHGHIEIPEWCDSNPSIRVLWTSTATSGVVQWDFSYYVVSGNDTESIDPSSWDEENILCSAADCVDTAPAAALRRLDFEITPATAANITGKGTIFWELSRDLSDSEDTMAATALVLDVMLECDGS